MILFSEVFAVRERVRGLILKGPFEKMRELECQGLRFKGSPGFSLKNGALDYLTVRWEH